MRRNRSKGEVRRERLGAGVELRIQPAQHPRAIDPELRPTVTAVADWLDATLAATLGFYVLPEPEARRRLRTTNALEREHEEVRRRTRVIRIFPSEPSYPRLVSALIMDRNDAWAKRRYMISAVQSLPPTAVTMLKRTRRRAA